MKPKRKPTEIRKAQTFIAFAQTRKAGETPPDRRLPDTVEPIERGCEPRAKRPSWPGILVNEILQRYN